MLSLLTACQNGTGDIYSYRTDMLASVPPLSGTETEVDEIRYEGTQSLSTTRFVLGQGGYGLLIDGMTGQSLGRFDVPEGEVIVGEVLNFGNGYFGLWVDNVTDDSSMWIINPDTGDLDNLADVTGVVHDEKRLRLLVLDGDLTIIHDLEITNTDLQDTLTQFGSHVTYESGQLLVYYVVDAWMSYINDENQTIRRYNVHTGEMEILFEMNDRSLIISEIALVGFEKIAFRGTIWHNEDNALRYGFIDLTTGVMTVFEEEHFRVNHDGLVVAGSSVLITEEFSPPTMGGGNVFQVDRGEVIVFNVETGHRQVIDVGGVSSFWAVLSLDGRYAVTVDETFSYLRKYDVTSGQLSFEVLISLAGDHVTAIIPLPNGDFGIRSMTLDSGLTSHFKLVTLP